MAPIFISVCAMNLAFPATHDPAGAYGLSPIAAHFAAGILHHMPALAAVTAPSVASYFRLTPDRWAPTWTNLGERDRGASLRICPTFAPADASDAASQFNLEYRVCDAAASPYMALGALVNAGADGIRRKLALPPPPTKSFWAMNDTERADAGVRRLPQCLDQAIDILEATPQVLSALVPPSIICPVARSMPITRPAGC
jgi:glutamine synthetase